MCQVPYIVDSEFASVSLVFLTRVDCVVKIRNSERDQAWDFGLAVVADAQQSNFVRAEIPVLKRVEFVLLAVFEAVKEAVAIGRLNREPIPASAQIDIAIISG